MRLLLIVGCAAVDTGQAVVHWMAMALNTPSLNQRSVSENSHLSLLLHASTPSSFHFGVLLLATLLPVTMALALVPDRLPADCTGTAPGRPVLVMKLLTWVASPRTLKLPGTFQRCSWN